MSRVFGRGREKKQEEEIRADEQQEKEIRGTEEDWEGRKLCALRVTIEGRGWSIMPMRVGPEPVDLALLVRVETEVV